MAADMAEIAVTLEGMLSKDMPRPAMSGVDTLDSVLAVDVVTNLRGPHAGTAAMQRGHIIGMAAVTGEAVIGEAVTGIRRILGSAITAWAMATHTMEVATTVTVMVGIIRTTEIGDTTLTSTDTGRP
jgi:hypothetical protein